MRLFIILHNGDKATLKLSKGTHRDHAEEIASIIWQNTDNVKDVILVNGMGDHLYYASENQKVQ